MNKKLIVTTSLLSLMLLNACSNETNVKSDDSKASIEKTVDYKTEAKENAKKHPMSHGAMLYDKKEAKFKGMNYFVKGEVVKTMDMKHLISSESKAYLVKDSSGYILPVIPPYEEDVKVGDTIEAYGPLSGQGYSSTDLDVDNVVGITGLMNATEVKIVNK